MGKSTRNSRQKSPSQRREPVRTPVAWPPLGCVVGTIALGGVASALEMPTWMLVVTLAGALVVLRVLWEHWAGAHESFHVWAYRLCGVPLDQMEVTSRYVAVKCLLTRWQALCGAGGPLCVATGVTLATALLIIAGEHVFWLRPVALLTGFFAVVNWVSAWKDLWWVFYICLSRATRF